MSRRLYYYTEFRYRIMESTVNWNEKKTPIRRYVFNNYKLTFY